LSRISPRRRASLTRRRHSSRAKKIQHRITRRTGHPTNRHPAHEPDFRRFECGMMEANRLWRLAVPAKTSRHGKLNFRWIETTQVEIAQRRFMRKHPNRLVIK